MNTFEEYWKNFGKLEHEVIKNPRELEEDFYNLAKKIWSISFQSSEMDYDKGYTDGERDATSNDEDDYDNGVSDGRQEMKDEIIKIIDNL